MSAKDKLELKPVKPVCVCVELEAILDKLVNANLQSRTLQGCWLLSVLRVDLLSLQNGLNYSFRGCSILCIPLTFT